MLRNKKFLLGAVAMAAALIVSDAQIAEVDRILRLSLDGMIAAA